MVFSRSAFRGRARNSRSVLLIEDESPFVSAILAVLHDYVSDFHVECAANSVEAEDLVRTRSWDVLIIDAVRAGDEELAMLREARARNADCDVVILTATPVPHVQSRAFEAGAEHFLVKPVDPRIFSGILGSLLFLPRDAGESMRGTVRNIQVSDLIQLKCLAGSNSLLEFTAGSGECGLIRFRNGNVVYAKANGTSGVEAFNSIVGWREGRFCELSVEGDLPRNIDLPWEPLLLEALRRADEGNHRRRLEA